MQNLGSILKTCITEDAYGGNVEAFRIEPAAAVMSPEGVLKVAVRADFVVSQADEERMREKICEIVPHVSGVQLRYIYDAEHMAQDEDGIVCMYAGRCISSLPPVVKNAVVADNITAEDGACVIRVIGGASLDEINKTFAARIRDKIHEKFGLDYI